MPLTRAGVTGLISLMLFLGSAGGAYPAVKLTADNVRIVDCLLPGKVKKLGINRTFISKKRPVKTSATDCEIRGGEYTQYDRADIKSALAVWQESAILGDAEAQYYVGEIFETGVGEAPNYKQALNWYEQSADQDYGPALMALGKLYESGLGVEKDLVKAMNFYRQASGLTEEDIEYASVFEALREQDLQQISSLEGQLEQQKRTTEALSQELDKLKAGLGKSDQRVRQLEQEINQKNSRINTLSQQVAEPPLVSTRSLENELAEARTELQKQGEMMLALKSELDIVKSGSGTSTSVEFVAEALESAEEELEKQTRETESKKAEILALKDKLNKLQANLEDYSPRKQVKLVRKEFQSAQKQLEQDLAAARAEVDAHKEAIDRLKDEAKKARKDSSVGASELKLVEFELEKAKQQLDARELDTRQKERKISLLEQELEFIKQQGKKSKGDQAATFAALKDSLAQREKLFDDQILQMNLALEKSQQATRTLEQQLLAARDKNTDKDRRIAALSEQIAEAEAKAEKAKQLIADRDELIEDKLLNIQSLKDRLAQLPTQADLVELRSTLALQQEELEKERNTAEKLNESIIQLEEEKAGMQSRLAKVAPEEGPVIAVRWPKTQDAGSTRAKVGAGAAVSMVGAVYPPKTIERFEINGKEEKLDSNGMFLHVVDVGSTPIEISLKAIDDLGKATTKTFTIEPSMDLDVALESTGSLTVPKVRFGKFHALVIGNNDYETKGGWPALSTAVNDAKEVARVLEEQYGFKVTLKLNATRDDMVVALEEMRRNLTEKENLLIYYAGHGYMDPENDQGYWIPVNGSTSSSAGWVSNSTITEQIRATSAKNIMVIADSCYSASLTRSGIVSLRSGLSPMKKMERLKSDIESITRMALSSGGLQPVADSIDGSGHSVFANALLNQLKQNQSILDGSALATQVGLNVAVATKDNVQQVPQYAPLHKGGHQGGEFYFVPKRT